MSSKFALFLFVAWLPAFIASLGFMAEYFAPQLQLMSGWKLVLIQYAALLIGFAPVLIAVFALPTKSSERVK